MACVSTEKQLRNGTYKYQYYVTDTKTREFYGGSKYSWYEEHFLIKYKNGRLRHEKICYYDYGCTHRSQGLLMHTVNGMKTDRWSEEDANAYLKRKGVIDD